MDEQQFWIRLREVIREEITTALQAYQVPVQEEAAPEMLTTTQLCERLKLSRQTLYNWQNNPRTKDLIAANKEKVGNKVQYNISGIKAAIKNTHYCLAVEGIMSLSMKRY